jgi:drug/metabolite transporter (DMT)-like permease
MAATAVISQISPKADQRFNATLLAAFFSIYVLWGTTFLAIRFAVAEIPPLLAAGARFFVAGVALYGFTRFKRASRPSAAQWRSLALIGFLMFVAEYGPLFWAEKYVSSGVTSVLAATLPLTTLILEIVVFRKQRFRWSALGATGLGFCGVAVLLLPNREQHVALAPTLAILAGSTCWSLGSVLTRSLDLPESKTVTAGASMLLGGGMLLGLSLLLGEWNPLPHVSLRAGLALLYLIICGSLIGFTAFVWLLGRLPATRVASHAYVNPLVAVALGYFMVGEIVTTRMFIGAAIVLISVFLLLRTKSNQPA